jgi:hypothetical protein
MRCAARAKTFPTGYDDVIRKTELADYSDIRVLHDHPHPYGYTLWEKRARC